MKSILGRWFQLRIKIHFLRVKKCFRIKVMNNLFHICVIDTQRRALIFVLAGKKASRRFLIIKALILFLILWRFLCCHRGSSPGASINI